jgi:hypothetical protein
MRGGYLRANDSVSDPAHCPLRLHTSLDRPTANQAYFKRPPFPADTQLMHAEIQTTGASSDTRPQAGAGR